MLIVLWRGSSPFEAYSLSHPCLANGEEDESLPFKLILLLSSSLASVSSLYRELHSQHLPSNLLCCLLWSLGNCVSGSEREQWMLHHCGMSLCLCQLRSCHGKLAKTHNFWWGTSLLGRLWSCAGARQGKPWQIFFALLKCATNPISELFQFKSTFLIEQSEVARDPLEMSKHLPCHHGLAVSMPGTKKRGWGEREKVFSKHHADT